jgi:uncharacterized membrane protein
MRTYGDSWDLLLVALLTVAGVGVVLLGFESVILRAFLTGPLVLLMPGYVLTLALFGRSHQDSYQRLLLVPGLSLMVAVLAGLLLNLLPWGLRSESWALILGATTLGASIPAYLRRGHGDETASPELKLAITHEQVLVFALAGLVTTAAFLTAWVGVERQAATPFTQFWLLPDQDDGRSIRLGIQNVEAEPVTYLLQVEVLDLAAEWPSITVQPGETWEDSLRLPRPALTRAAIEARLYKVDDAPAQIYRRGRAWLEAERPGHEQVSNQ